MCECLLELDGLNEEEPLQTEPDEIVDECCAFREADEEK